MDNPNRSGRARSWVVRSTGGAGAALALIFGASVSACSSSSNTSSYPPNFVSGFVQGCSTGQGAAPESVCRCLANAVEKDYSYSEVLTWKDSKGNYNPPASAIKKLTQSCGG